MKNICIWNFTYENWFSFHSILLSSINWQCCTFLKEFFFKYDWTRFFFIEKNHCVSSLYIDWMVIDASKIQFKPIWAGKCIHPKLQCINIAFVSGTYGSFHGLLSLHFEKFFQHRSHHVSLIYVSICCVFQFLPFFAV